jgi:hypothetical protein
VSDGGLRQAKNSKELDFRFVFATFRELFDFPTTQSERFPKNKRKQS